MIRVKEVQELLNQWEEINNDRRDFVRDIFEIFKIDKKFGCIDQEIYKILAERYKIINDTDSEIIEKLLNEYKNDLRVGISLADDINIEKLEEI